ncbi:PLC-like phosphodiesterase [Plenodomus tracheiphilus IPT5]|uniref:Phosphoinositide phospholipase C n=1 Tax=Plenodomus tracheiphilus IPT5 TaxID=1408161 RepID=A0A6A7BBD5_9PLEO|nr:PLC-like phosphodiesterase [Plenodomus tracheiphilus IPT5]
MSEIVSGIAKLNPFSKKSRVDDEDKGEAIDAGTVAGGGHASRQSHITKDELRVSQALRRYLVEEKVLGEAEAGVNSEQPTTALRELVSRSHLHVPPEVINRNHPLPEYFISSSHNTYLMAHQLYGESHASAYEIALHTGSRCVEIDAWDNDDDKEEPKVTHGWTLTSNIPFRAVCETIRDVIDKEAANEKNAAPILISLENHCDAYGQRRLAQIMQEVWGHRLLSKAIREKGMQEQEDHSQHDHVTLAELGNRIAVIVEYHLPDEQESSDSDSSSDEEETDKQARQEYAQKKKATNAGLIVPELAELGVYAQSVKPVNNSWFEADLENAPHHQLINVSESGLKAHLPANSSKIARHNAHHLMRVYPKGTRISSRNLQPVPFWGIGAQICALNWQTFGASSQVNEALFAGSGGYVLKPAALRAGGDGNLSTGRRRKLRLHVAGATDIPLPRDREHEDIKPYLTCTLVHANDMNNMPPKRKTAGYKPHKLTSFMHKDNSPSTDPVWKEVLEWEYDDNELVFLRMLIKSDDSFSRNPIFAVSAIRLMYAVPGWCFIRMLDLGGHETKCTLLVRFEFVDI